MNHCFVTCKAFPALDNLSDTSKYCQCAAPQVMAAFAPPETVTEIWPISGCTSLPSTMLLKYPVPASCFSDSDWNIVFPVLIVMFGCCSRIAGRVCTIA